MELHSNKERLVSDLDRFDQSAVRRDAAQSESRFLEALPVVVVEFVAVAMPLTDMLSPIAGCDLCPLAQPAWISPKFPLKSALFEFFRVDPLDADSAPCEFPCLRIIPDAK